MPKRFLWTIIVFLIIGLLVYLVFTTSSPSKEIIQSPSDSQIQENIIPASNDLTMPESNENTAVYELKKEESTLEWKAERIIGNSHTGTVDISQGYLVKENDAFARGEFLIDMQTITESKNNERFLNHVKTEDFFAVDIYPISKLTFKNIENVGEQQYNVIADLTILDQTHEITFPATVNQENQRVEAQAEFTIDRTRWGIVYDSGSLFQQLGDKAIKDDIYYKITVTLEETI